MAKLILILAAVVLISLACSTLYCASPTITVTPTPTPADAGEATPTDSAIDLSEVKEDAVRRLYDSSGNLINSDRKSQAISRKYEGGFGGFYFDDDDPSVVYVYMLDPTKASEAEMAFRAVHTKDRKYTKVVPVQGLYSLDELTDWFYLALEAFNDSDAVVLTIWGLSELNNALEFSVHQDLDAAWAVIDSLGIPRGAVILDVGGVSW